VKDNISKIKSCIQDLNATDYNDYNWSKWPTK